MKLSAEPKKVLIINGYSASNRGDGLLVELARDLVIDGSKDISVEVSAAVMDPGSFNEIDGVEIISTFRSHDRLSLIIGGFVALLTCGKVGFSKEYRNAMRQADLILSVGGAYHRGADLVELIKSALAHGSQARTVHASRKPWILLPQSIGPLPKAYYAFLKGIIRTATAVFARDDITFAELSPSRNLFRTPDSAILALGTEQRKQHISSGSDVGLVIRELPRPGTYVESLRLLIEGNPFNWKPLVQSSFSGNDDRPFYSAFSLEPKESLHEVLEEQNLGLVVSVRLHGALESIMKGVPAIHLSYERKGFSAYQDLGLGEYVFDARDFDPDKIASKIQEVLSDPQSYWSHVENSLPQIRDSREAVTATIHHSLAV